MMSKDKYLSIFSPQMEAIVHSIVQIIFAMHTVLKIGEYSQTFSSFDWEMFGHVQKYLMDYNNYYYYLLCFNQLKG